MSAPTLVVGTGLIGTSVALALRAAGRDVLLADPNPAVLEQAISRGAGAAWSAERAVAHVVIGAPPGDVAGAVRAALGRHVEATVMDTSSIKSLARLEVKMDEPGLARYAGTHPMAGNAGRGPQAAAADLFVGRAWALCPHPDSSADAVAAARSVILDCGGMPVECAPEEHDEAVALVSHLPQVLASALAAALQEASPTALALAGPALQDMTRVAASPEELWEDILIRNQSLVAAAVSALGLRLAVLEAALAHAGPGAGAAVRHLLRDGRAGLARLPGKHAGPRSAIDVVVVLLRDEPAALARLLAAVAAAGVNVEDLRIEHAPGAALGSAQLAVQPGAGAPLVAALAPAGWSASLATEAGR